MNPIDKLIAPFFPEKAVKRAQARQVLAAYEAAQPSRTRKNPSDNSSGNTLTQKAGDTIRGQARHLEQNHDLCRGILNTLVSYTVGANGIGIESQVLNKQGQIHKEFSNELQHLFKDWSRKPETTHQYSWAKTQRMVARAWFRDGEVLSKSVMGTIASLNHGTRVPFSIELLEADHIADVNEGSNIVQGIEHNAWGQPTYLHLYDQNPQDRNIFNMKHRKVSADIINHVKFTDRLRQARGVSIFASVLTRLNDLKDYEESERVAAKISAAMAAYIKKGSPDQYGMSDTGGDDDEREFSMGSGMIWDNLAPGEEVGTIQSNRPSQLLLPFRNAMLRAIASGTGSGYSSISKTYDGNYSSQRQELVEQWIQYAVLSNEFIQQFVEPTYMQFVKIAIASGQIKVPKDVDRRTLYDADYLTPTMPWIDPKKEADGHEKLLQLKITSPQKIIRQRGDNPNEILDQNEKWQNELKDRGLSITETNQPANAGFFTPKENEDEE
jgi:lambda family phage portal protein